MRVRDIMVLAAELAGRRDLADFTAGRSGADAGAMQRERELLLRCYNLTENEIALDYLPLRREERFESDGCVPYAAFAEPPVEILSVRDEAGTVLKTPCRIVLSDSADPLPDGWERVSLHSPEEWEAFLLELGKRPFVSLLLEGGGELAASALNAGAVDDLVNSLPDRSDAGVSKLYPGVYAKYVNTAVTDAKGWVIVTDNE